MAAVRLGVPPLLEHSHAELLEEAAPRSCDGDGSGGREVDTAVGTHLIVSVDETLSVVGFWGGMALEWFPLPLAKDEIEVGSAMGMLHLWPLHPYIHKCR